VLVERRSSASVTHRVDAARMMPAYFEQRAFAQGISESYAAIRRHGGFAGRDFRHWLAPIVGSWTDRRLTAGAAEWDAVVQWRAVLQAVRAAHRRGVHFHRAEVRRDPALLAWVLKEDYL
jgi:hypothetical protein